MTNKHQRSQRQTVPDASPNPSINHHPSTINHQPHRSLRNRIEAKETANSRKIQNTVLGPTGRRDSTSTTASLPRSPHPEPSSCLHRPLGCSLCRGVLANGGPRGRSASVSCIAFASISALLRLLLLFLCPSLPFPPFSFLELDVHHCYVCTSFCQGVSSLVLGWAIVVEWQNVRYPMDRIIPEVDVM